MNCLSFKEFVDKYGIKEEATFNVKIKEIPHGINIPRNAYLKVDKFTTTAVIVKFHTTKVTLGMFVDQYFDTLIPRAATVQ